MTPSSSFGPSLECPVVESAQISWISPLSAFLIFLDLALVIGPTRTCNGSFNSACVFSSVFFGKTNSRGLLRQNWAKFSSRTNTHHIVCLVSEIGLGPFSSKNSDRKRIFWDGRNFAPGHFCPQSRHLVRLAHNIGEVRLSTKIQTENVFYGKTNSRGLLR